MSRSFPISASSFALGIACSVGGEAVQAATLTVNAETQTAGVIRLGQSFAVPNGIGEVAEQAFFGPIFVGPFSTARGEAQAIAVPNAGIGVFAESSALFTCGEASCGDQVEQGFPEESLTLVTAQAEASARETFVNSGPASNFTLAFVLAPGSAALRDQRRSDPSLDPYQQISTIGWLLDGAPIWTYTFGLESRGYDDFTVIDEVFGSGIFPDSQCSIEEAEAACEVDLIAGTLELGAIGAGQSFELELFVRSISNLPPATIDCTDDFVDCMGDVAFAGARLSDPGVPATLQFTASPLQVVPVAPALPLLATAIAGLALAGRRRRG